MQSFFRCRINNVDYYQAEPIPELDPAVPFQTFNNLNEGTSDNVATTYQPKLSVLRVFGATETGQKVLMHVHGVLQYTYIEYSGSLNTKDVDLAIEVLHKSVDHALAVSFRQDPFTTKNKYVAHISLVKGVPFYGFHVGYKFYLKIYLLNPLHMTRLADLLREGAVMRKVLQPYESHMQYIAQWMCDYNLFGCAFIECSKVKFRSPVPDFAETSEVHPWHSKSIPSDMISNEDMIPKDSYCALEVDIRAEDILNRHVLRERSIHQDFLERKRPGLFNSKLVESVRTLWDNETKRRQARNGGKDLPFSPGVLVSMSAELRNSLPAVWIHEQEFRDKVERLAKEEHASGIGSTPSYDKFVKKVDLEDSVCTAFESVHDLFSYNIARLITAHEESYVPRGTQAIVDEALILGKDGVEDEEDEAEDAKPNTVSEMETSEAAHSSAATGSSASSESRVKEPVTPEQYATLGIRVDGDVNDLDEDSFELNKMHDSDDTAPGSSLKGIRSLPQGVVHETTVKEPIEPESYADFGVRAVGDAESLESDTFEPPETAALVAESNKEGDARALIHDEVGVSRLLEQNATDTASNEDMEDGASVSTKTTISGIQASKSSLKRTRFEDYDTTPSKKARFATDAEMVANTPTAAGGVGAGDHSRLAEEQALEEHDPRFQGQEDTDVPRQVEHVPQASSQGTSQQTRLSFAVVKDPNDPNTIKRLSQKSNSPVKTFAKPLLQTSTPANLATSSVTPAKSLLTSSIGKTSASSLRESSLSLSNLKKPKDGNQILKLGTVPPKAKEVIDTMHAHGLPSIVYQDAYYSTEGDMPEISREYAGKEFKLESGTVPFLPEFGSKEADKAAAGEKDRIAIDRIKGEEIDDERREECSYYQWSVAAMPPRRTAVERYFASNRRVLPSVRKLKKDSSQINGPTQVNGGFKYSSRQQSTSVQHDTQYMSVMSLEVHVNTRGKLSPNPEHDEITCIFWCIQSDDKAMIVDGDEHGVRAGIVANSADTPAIARRISQIMEVDVQQEASEIELLARMVEIVRHWDPDILTGYEVHMSSWGYLIERARLKYDLNFCDDISRMKSQSHGRFGKDDDRWGFNHTSTIRVTGRHTINIWRAMRSELNLLQYTMENVTYHLLHKRIPHYTFADLTQWYKSGRPTDLKKVVEYFHRRAQIDLQILEANELVPRTSEQARVIGVDWFSVISRGSQYKVENIMFRIAKSENLMLVSPSRRQVGGQNALECLPLVMEPQSNFYTSPVLVFDFQSLYPSIMIAYNYCYSTFLGRVVDWRGANKMGFMNYERQKRLLEFMKDDINVAPNGIMYVKQHIRRSLLAKMLAEILETRVMIKSGMKEDKDDKTLQRLLNNRQLALKLIANVTYGYTSASFSGRMPCSEIADSIVQTGRETLEKAIALIHSVSRWGAEVVYGDTDSIFVHLKGRTREEAFTIGNEISDAITKSQPKPIKLKFEKVYHPCVLLAKKRYVGFKYENPKQTKPEFEAKGIETVRRDGTPAEQKIEEVALKLLFRTADLSQVKKYFQSQCTKIMLGKVSIQDFCFAREVKLGTYSDKGPPPPGALISARKMLEDPRLEPQYGERVPYVVVSGGPDARLIDRCVAPDVLLDDQSQQLDAEYYIRKNIIPPLERIFNLVGANVRQWYDEMPKLYRTVHTDANEVAEEEEEEEGGVLEGYMKTSSCIICGSTVEEDLPLCESCFDQPEYSLQAMRLRLMRADAKVRVLEKTCRGCSGFHDQDEITCDSKDCPVFYSRVKAHNTQRNLKQEYEPMLELLEDQALANEDLAW